MDDEIKLPPFNLPARRKVIGRNEILNRLAVGSRLHVTGVMTTMYGEPIYNYVERCWVISRDKPLEGATALNKSVKTLIAEGLVTPTFGPDFSGHMIFEISDEGRKGLKA